MRKRLFLYTILIVCFGLFCFFGASVYVTYQNNLNFAKDTVSERAQIYADLYSENNHVTEFGKDGNNTRITVISSYGKVITDNHPLDVSSLENHLNRPEIQAALSGSPAAQVRYSKTLGTDLIYYALKVPSGDSYVFIRVALPVAQIDAYLLKSLPLLVFVLVLLVFICFFFANRMAGKIIKPLDNVGQRLMPLANGETSRGFVEQSYEEINLITRKIDDVAVLLQRNIENLSSEKSKLDYILDNIGDGLVTVNGDGNITLVNAGALRIFNATEDIVGKKLNYLTYDKALSQAVEDSSSNGQSALFELNINGSIYITTVKILPDTNITMVVLSDVTENRESARRREEFFANASHELKTPLTTIKGFNELASINNKDEKLNKYLAGITREVGRMLFLISDMLRLSELESSQSLKSIPILLSKIICESFITY